MAVKKITKTELIKRTAKQSGVSRKITRGVVNACFAEIKKKLKRLGGGGPGILTGHDHRGAEFEIEVNLDKKNNLVFSSRLA